MARSCTYSWLLLAVLSAAQDREASIFDSAKEALCETPAGAASKPVPTITEQFNTTGVRVSGVAGADAVYLVNQAGSVIAFVEGTPIGGEMDWTVCWHKDVATNYHLTSEAVTQLEAVAHYPAPGCQKSYSAAFDTWYYKVSAYEQSALDKSYGSWSATVDELAEMTPTLTANIDRDSRMARATIRRLEGKYPAQVDGIPMPFVYVKDTAGRVLWYQEFPVDDTRTVTTEWFEIPLLSSIIMACTQSANYTALCSEKLDLTSDIVGTFAGLSSSPLPQSRGTYRVSSTGDTYTVTPLGADYAGCPGTYVLWATSGGATLGMSIGSSLSVPVGDYTAMSFYLACPEGTSTLELKDVDLVAAREDAPKGTGGSISGSPGDTTATHCGEHEDESTWSCGECGEAKCICEAGLVSCVGKLPNSPKFTSEESVGIGIGVVVIVLVIAFFGYFLYKKRMLTHAKETGISLEQQPMAGSGSNTREAV